MDRPYEAEAKAAQVYLLQQDYKKAIKEVKRLAALLKDIGILVD